MPGYLLFHICPMIWNAAHTEMFVSHMLALEAVTSSLPAEHSVLLHAPSDTHVASVEHLPLH